MIVAGLRNSLHRAKKRIFGEPKKNPIAAYGFVSEVTVPRQEQQAPAEPRTVTWIVTPFKAGSGGHINIFRFVGLLERLGFKNRIVVLDGRYFGGVTGIKKLMFDSFERLDVPVHVELADAPVSAMTVATSWTSAYTLRNYRANTRPVYFVQDFEPWFHPHSADYELANNTYKFGFRGLTAGSWLQGKLSDAYGMTCSNFSFSTTGTSINPASAGGTPASESSSTRAPRPIGERSNSACWFSMASPSSSRR